MIKFINEYECNLWKAVYVARAGIVYQAPRTEVSSSKCAQEADRAIEEYRKRTNA